MTVNIYDMQLETAQILQKVDVFKLVVPDYPKKWETFPMAVYRTKNTPFFIDSNKDELQTSWIITIEIYFDDGSADLVPIVYEIDEKFKNIGFVGGDTDANTGDLQRKILEYRAIVDNVTHFVFQK